MWLFVGALAWGADPVGFWHPDDLAALSVLYASSSEQLQAPFGARNQELERTAAAIREYRVALDLLGDRAAPAERARLEALETAHAANYAATDKFAGELVEDYDAAFTTAVERAASAVGVVVRCNAEIPVASSGPRIPGSPRKTVPNPECKGRNLNAELAKAVDADAAANSAIAGIVARPWPTLAPLPAEPQPVVGAGERWLRVVDVLRSGARGALTAIERQDDDAREAVEAAMEQATTEAELQALVPKVAGIEAETRAARTALAAPILAVAESRMAKWKGEPATAWCANPSGLGGCVGADAGVDVLAKLVADKKVAAAFPAP